MELYAHASKSGREDEGKAMLDEVAIARNGRMVRGTSTALRVGAGYSAPSSTLYKVEPAYTEEAACEILWGDGSGHCSESNRRTAQNFASSSGGLASMKSGGRRSGPMLFKPGRGRVLVTVAANIWTELNFRLM